MAAKEREEGGGVEGEYLFYFNGTGKGEDSPSELDDDSYSLEDKWGEGREYGEDADKEKNIKMDRGIFTMTCLDFVLDEINPLVFLHLDMEGWGTYNLRGAGVTLCGVGDTCFLVCEVWDERDRKRRHLDFRYANGFGPPCDDVLAAMAEHPNFDRDRRYRQ